MLGVIDSESISAYQHWVLNGGLDPKVGDGRQQNRGQRQLPNQWNGGQPNNQGNGG